MDELPVLTCARAVPVATTASDTPNEQACCFRYRVLHPIRDKEYPLFHMRGLLRKIRLSGPPRTGASSDGSTGFRVCVHAYTSVCPRRHARTARAFSHNTRGEQGFSCRRFWNIMSDTGCPVSSRFAGLNGSWWPSSTFRQSPSARPCVQEGGILKRSDANHSVRGHSVTLLPHSADFTPVLGLWATHSVQIRVCSA